MCASGGSAAADYGSRLADVASNAHAAWTFCRPKGENRTAQTAFATLRRARSLESDRPSESAATKACGVGRSGLGAQPDQFRRLLQRDEQAAFIRLAGTGNIKCGPMVDGSPDDW